jgi:hypothetical protein
MLTITPTFYLASWLLRKFREKIKTCAAENEKKALTKKLNEKSLALALILERNKRKK